MLGGEIASQLAAGGFTGRALVRRPHRAGSLTALGFEIVVGDLAKPQTLEAALDDVDRVLLCSGDDPDQVALQRNLIDASINAGVRQVVKVSAHTAGSTPPVSFGVAHRQVEDYLARTDLSYTIVRPYLLMQNFVRFALNIVSRGKVIAPVKDAGIALVDMRDVAAVVVRALTQEGHAGRIYEVSGPESLTFERATHIISHVVGRPVTHISPPPFLTGWLLRWLTDLPRRQIPFVCELFASIREGEQENVTDVVAQVAAQIPRTFDEYVREHVGLFAGSREGGDGG